MTGEQIVAKAFPEQRMFTVREVAHFFRDSQDYVRRACRGGQLSALKVGGRWHIGRHGMALWIDSSWVD